MNLQISKNTGHRVLTTAQAAKALGYSVRTLEDWRLKRKGPVYLKQSGAKNKEAFYLLSDLYEFATSHPRVPSKSKNKKRK